MNNHSPLKQETLDALGTEQVNPASWHIDEMNTAEILATINNEDHLVANCVKSVIPAMIPLIDAIQMRMQTGGRVLYIGAGTSGRLGVLDASECPPTYGVPAELIQGHIAGGFGALLKAKEGAEDSMELAKDDLIQAGLTASDTVIGIAASGRTPYVIGGLLYAKKAGALTGSISCVKNAAISSYAEYPIECETGPEVITGSTRMKAGTAQKMILNMISTSLMIKYGKVYHNLMIDVQPTNEKLVDRALRIISNAGECSMDEANAFFKRSGRNVKLAICLALTKLPLNECRECLEQNHGNVSAVLHEYADRQKNQ